MFIRFCLQLPTKIVGFINQKHKNSRNPKKNNKNSIQDLTQCKYCGLYIPLEEAIDYNGNTFCCKEHAK